MSGLLSQIHLLSPWFPEKAVTASCVEMIEWNDRRAWRQKLSLFVHRIRKKREATELLIFSGILLAPGQAKISVRCFWLISRKKQNNIRMSNIPRLIAAERERRGEREEGKIKKVRECITTASSLFVGKFMAKQNTLCTSVSSEAVNQNCFLLTKHIHSN